MDDKRTTVAKACLDGAEKNTMTLPQIVGTLMQEGFESYAIEFRRGVAAYYLGFCKNAASAGCAGYLVSVSGRRALYIGRTGETYVEHFPQQRDALRAIGPRKETILLCR